MSTCYKFPLVADIFADSINELGEVLSFNSDELYYYVFRDLASGLEFIRHGWDLDEKGLYVELEGNEYHAFLDFREIRDND